MNLCYVYVARYRQPPVVHSDAEEREALAMLAKVNTPNRLKERVERNPNLRGRAQWNRMNATAIPNFPVLDEDYLRECTFGVYQVAQGKNYADEHLKQGTYEVNVFFFNLIFKGTRHFGYVFIFGRT